MSYVIKKTKRSRANQNGLDSKKRVVSGSHRQGIHIQHGSEPKKRVVSGSHGQGINNPDSLAGNSDEDEDIIHLTKEDFEASIKLITNNKINSINTWDVPIIEYFYDMNLLRADDGVSINFQMASATLDGCTKVISKRVDSVGLDTDALIQILALNHDQKKNSRRRNGHDNADDDDGENSESDPDYTDKRKVSAKSASDDIPITTMDKIKISDRQLECVMVDPVFRKMLTEFDEGGAKSLLLNSLVISEEGKILFDDKISGSSDANMTVTTDSNTVSSAQEVKQEDTKMDLDVPIGNTEATASLINTFKGIIHDPQFNHLSICEEINDIKSSIANVELGQNFINKMARKSSTEDMKTEGNTNTDDMFPEFNAEYDYDIDNFELNINNDLNNNVNGFDLSDSTNIESVVTGGFNSLFDGMQNDGDVHMATEEELLKKEFQIMQELDQRSTGKRKPHWKIQTINSTTNLLKRNSDLISSTSINQSDQMEKNTNSKTISKNKTADENNRKKNEHVIDFMNDTEDLEVSKLFERSARPMKFLSSDQINVELTTLEDLKSWNSERLVTSLLKPKRKFRNIFNKKSTTTKAELCADRDFWASKYNDNNMIQKDDNLDEDVEDFLHDVMDKDHDLPNNEHVEPADFGMDHDPGVYDFDAPMGDVQLNKEVSESKPLIKSELMPAQKAAWHKDSINYERRSKKINVRLLKKNLWEATKGQVLHNSETAKAVEDVGSVTHHDLKLSNIVKDTYIKYQGREKADLSTSFFFICMLHIANEEGLTIEKTDDLSDLIIHGNQ